MYTLTDESLVLRVLDCTEYGHTYIAHPGKNFYADSIEISNRITAEECSWWCTDITTCLGFSHSPTYDVGGWCSMHTTTPRIEPNYYDINSGSNFTYYLRNCAAV